MSKMREERIKHGYTLKQIGSMIGVSEASVSLYETGKREPSNDTLKFLADLYGVTVDYLLGRESSTITVQGAKGNQQPQNLATFQISADAPKIKPFHDLPQEEYTVISDDFKPTRGPATRAIINSILAKLAQLDEESQKEADTFIDFMLAKKKGE